MKKAVSWFLSFILIGCVACNQKQQQKEGKITFKRSDFKVEKQLSGRTLEFDSLILQPSQLQLYDSILVTCNNGADKIFHLFNLYTAQKVGECISMGQGPEEMMVPGFVNRTDSVMLFDKMTSTLFSYSVPSFVSGKEPQSVHKIGLEIKPLWSNICCLNNGFVGISYHEESPAYLFDKSGKKIKNFGSYLPTERAYTPTELVNVYRADLMTNGTDKVAITHYFTDLICLYDAEGHLKYELRGPDHFSTVFKAFTDGDIVGSKADPKSYRDAFYSPVSVGDCLYVLYNGKMVAEEGYNLLCKELFVFGWDGSLECHYTLDRGVSSIAVDSQNRKIYGISDDPEYHIVEFSY